MLSPAIARLIHQEPFYANLIMNMTRNYTTDLPTVGVNVTDTVNLHVNPYFWQSLSIEEQVDILKHECYHVLNNHIGRFKETEPELFDESKEEDMYTRLKAMVEFRAMNIAADAAINQFLPNIPKVMRFFDKEGKLVLQPDKMMNEKGEEVDNPNKGQPLTGSPITLENFREEYCKKAEGKQAMEYYYELIQQDKQKNPGKYKTINVVQGAGRGMPIDDHSMWQKSGADPEYIKEKLKKLVNDAAEQTESRNAGSIPSDVAVLISALNHVPKDWRNDLQRFVARTSEIVIESSRKKRDRRYGLLYPGKLIYPKMHLAVAIDTSGSIQEEELSQFTAEIERISKCGVKITLIECDSVVHQVFEFDARKMKEIKFLGRGGTAFQPSFDVAEKLEVDGLIYFTDGCNFDTLTPPKRYQVMWALIKGYEKNFQHKFGHRTVIEVKKKVKSA